MIIELLAKTSKIEEAKLLSLASTASDRYKVYRIPKRTGGFRKIEHPSRQLKSIQRWLVKAVFARFPVHEMATAYRKGSGIKANAEVHRLTKFTNRYDFKDFFPSFSKEQVMEFVSAQSQAIGMKLSDRDLEFIGSIVCRNGYLTIGAPSSPAITNAMMFEFDQRLHDACQRKGLVFTRYADDVFVSAFEPGKLVGLGPLIAECKRGIPHLRLRLNHKKTVSLSKKYHRSVAGIVITPDHRLSIGRKRKREIKSLIYSWINNKLDAEKVPYMKGLFAFAIDIEPQFEQRLIDKYGVENIARLRKGEDDQSVKVPF